MLIFQVAAGLRLSPLSLSGIEKPVSFSIPLSSFSLSRKKKKSLSTSIPAIEMTVGTMEVHLVSARGLKSTDFLGNIDPYVLVQYKGQERKSSIARGQGSNPEWDEKLTFRAEYPGGDEEYKLILKIMDHDNFSSDDYIGEAIIYLKEFLQLGVENGKAEIHTSKYSIVAGDQTFAGEIKVGLTFTAKEGQNEREEFGGWKESGY